MILHEKNDLAKIHI